MYNFEYMPLKNKNPFTLERGALYRLESKKDNQPSQYERHGDQICFPILTNCKN